MDTDSDIRLARRIKRDIVDRCRELKGVLKQYDKFVKPAMDHYISPTMAFADIIVPRGKAKASCSRIEVQIIAIHSLCLISFKHKS